MSILSTNSRLIKVGQDYSAGSGISIDDHTISVTGSFGNTYSAGNNISIYNQGEQLYISSKDWEQDIANASANAYNAATAEIPDPIDTSYLSAQIDNKLDATAFTNWQNGQYSTDLQTIEGQINNKLNESAFSQVSGDFLTAINIPESATWNEVSQVYEQASATYLTSVNIPESAVWQDVSTTVQSNSAQWAEGGAGDEEVNSFVYENSATINDVNTSYQTNSGTFLTSVDLSPYYTTADANTLSSMLSGAIDYVSANAGGAFPYSAEEAINAYQTNSGDYLIKTASMPTIGRNLTGHGVFGLAVGARSKSFDYGLSIGEYANKYVSKARSNAAIGYSAHAYGTGSQAFGEQVVVSGGMAIGQCNKTSACSFVIGNGTSNTARSDIFVINYDGSVSAAGKISANGVELGTGGGNKEIESYVQNNSATIDETVTTYQSNSGSYQPSGNYIPYTAVDPVFNSFETNSGLDVTTSNAGRLRSTSLRENFIKVSYIDSTIGINNHSTLTTYDLTFSTSSDSAYVDMEKIHTWDSASNYIQNISSTWNDVSTTVQSNSAQWAEGVTGEFVPQSAFDELKQSYDALSSLFATYSGQWLLPNEGV